MKTVEKMSFAPERVAEFAIPLLFGTKDGFGSVLRRDYGGDFPWAQSVFVGVALLAGIVATVRRGQSTAVRWGWEVIAVGLCLALGRHLPFYRAAYLCLPGFSVFRHPEKYMIWVHFGMCVVGGAGLEEACTASGGRRALACLAACGAVIVGLLFGLTLWYTVSGHSYATWMRAGGSQWAPARLLRFQLLQGAVSLLAVLICAGFLLRRLGAREGPPRAFLGPVLVVTFLHLLFVGASTRWTIPGQWLTSTRTAADWLPVRGRGRYRIFVDNTQRTTPAPTPGKPLLVQEKLRELARLAVNVPSLFGIRAASGFSPLAPAAYRNLIDFHKHNPLLIMDLCSVRYVIVDGILKPGRVPPGNRIAHIDRQYGYTILEDPTAYPRIYVTGPACQIVDKKDVLKTAFEIARERHRTGPNAALPPPTPVLGKKPDRPVPASREVIAGLTIMQDAPGRTTVACTGPAWLVVRDWRYNGWQALIDHRQSAEVRAVDGDFMGVFVPVGRHTVALSYHPPGFVPGMVMCVFGCLLLFFCWLDPLVLLDTPNL